MKRLAASLTAPHPLGYDVGLLLLRLWVGLVMAFGHGLGKFGSEKFLAGVVELGLPAPEVMALLAALSEFVGGLLLALGLLTRPAAFTIVITMAVAAFGRHADDPFRMQEMALFYGVAALGFVFTGAGRLSLDHLIWRKVRNPHALS